MADDPDLQAIERALSAEGNPDLAIVTRSWLEHIHRRLAENARYRRAPIIDLPQRA